GLDEIAQREDVPLLAYSPLAMGVLTGKYEGGRASPPDARMTRFERFRRYSAPLGLAQSEKYVALARAHGLDPAPAALAFVTSRPFVASTLIGATSLEQLRSNLGAADLTLPDALREAYDAVHRESPN